MKSHLLILVLVILPLARAQVAPASTPEAAWASAVLAEKPYVLEIRYGNADAPLTDRKVTPEFLAQASHLAVASSGNDAGEILVGDGTRLVYEIRSGDPRFSVRIAFETSENGGQTRMRTQTGLTEGEWVVLGERRGVLRSTSAGEQSRNSYVAVKLSRRP